MTLANSALVNLMYGATGRFSIEIDARRIAALRPGPEPSRSVAEDLRSALRSPLDFPDLSQAVIPDDRVALVLDRHTPEAALLIAEVWQVLAGRDVNPDNVLILQPNALDAAPLSDPRSALPRDVRSRIGWKVHDPNDRKACMYLASTAGGERIYLAREAVDVEVAIAIGPMTYDGLIGYRGTNSVFYPGLSTSESLERAHGQGHSELGPEDTRPLRQLMDEVGWLLGTLFAVQVIPSGGGGVAHVLAGAIDSVYREGKRLLNETWGVELAARPDMVVCAVDEDAGGHGWEQIGAALSVARNLVARGGKIVILSQLESPLGEGLKFIAAADDPSDALQPLRKAAPSDLVPATQLINAVDWADVYLLSRIDSDLVEDLFLIPIENETEAARLMSSDDSCAFLGSAQYAHGQIAEAEARNPNV